jgi:hypothetical protein
MLPCAQPLLLLLLQQLPLLLSSLMLQLLLLMLLVDWPIEASGTAAALSQGCLLGGILHGSALPLVVGSP